MCRRILLLVAHCKFYSDSHSHSQQFRYIFHRGLLHHIHEISLLGTLKQWLICKLNVKMEFQDYTVLNLRIVN